MVCSAKTQEAVFCICSKDSGGVFHKCVCLRAWVRVCVDANQTLLSVSCNNGSVLLPGQGSSSSSSRRTRVNKPIFDTCKTSLEPFAESTISLEDNHLSLKLPL